MNIEFAICTKLPGIENTVFPPGHPYGGSCYQSEIIVGDDPNIGVYSFCWNIHTAELMSVGIGRFGGSVLLMNNVKTFENLKDVLAFIGLPYPENWP